MQRIMVLLKSGIHQIGLGADPKGSKKLCGR
jgi:hypothetical protein